MFDITARVALHLVDFHLKPFTKRQWKARSTASKFSVSFVSPNLIEFGLAEEEYIPTVTIDHELAICGFLSSLAPIAPENVEPHVIPPSLR